MADLDFQPLDFQPEDQQPAVPTAPVQPSGNSGQLDFKPLDFQPDTPTDSGVISKPAGGSPLVFSGLVKPEEVKAIADKHGIDADHLKAIAPYFGVNLEPNSLGESAVQGAKATAGELGNTAGLGLPQFAYKHLAMDPKERQALDDLNDLSKSRESLQDKALGVGRMLVTPIAGLGAKSALGRIGEAAGVGGIIGATGAREGEELKGAQQGAVLGGAFGAGVEGIGRLLGSGVKLSPAELENVRTRQLDLQKGIDDIADKTKTSEDIITDLGMGGKTSLTQPEATTIVKEQLGEEGMSKYLDPSTQEGKSIREKLGPGANENDITNELADQIVSDRVEGFAGELSKGKAPKDTEEAMKAIDEYASRQGEEHTAQKYQQYVEGLQAQKFIEDSGAMAKDTPGFFGMVANKLSDNQYALRNIDDKYGTRAEDAMRNINQANNRYSYARTKSREDLDKIFRQASKEGVDGTIRDSDKLYRALDTGDTAGLSLPELNALDNFKGYFRDTRDFANGVVKAKDPGIAPLNIPKLENYVPHIPKQIDEIIPIIEQKTDDALTNLSEKYGRKIDELGQLSKPEYEAAVADGTLKDLTDFANWAESVKTQPKSAQELSKKIDSQLYTRQGNIGLESKARAALERTGEIPDFLLEKNLYKLADKYALNTYKHLYLRNPLAQLGLEADKLKGIGADSESEYVSKMIQDSLGVRPGTAAEAFMKLKVETGRKFDKLIDSVGGPQTINGTILQAAKHYPDYLFAVIRNMYPNVLGYWNVRAAMQHMVTGFTRMAPELGGTYGYKKVVEGTFATAMNFKRYLHLAEGLGNIPSEFTRKGEQALAEGIMKSGLIRTTADGYNKLAKAGMILFQTGEKWNRALVVGIADHVAADIARGNSEAISSLRNFPYSVRKAVMANPTDHNAVFNILARHLNDTTIFNYNRAAMFEYGRTLGPMLSTFSKWPTAIYGEARYDLMSKGLVGGSAKILQRLVVPYLMLRVADYALFNMSADKHDSDMSDREKKLVGSKGFSKMAPIGALSEFTSGKIFTPPAVDLVVNDILKPTSEGDASKLSRGLDTILRYSLPGSGLIRFATDDLVTLATGQQPQGSTFIEKTANGLDKLTK